MWFFTIVLKNLLHRKIRTGLTVMGMSVAVCAVVTMVGISQGFEQAIAAIFETRGVDIIVSRNSPQRLATTVDQSLAEKFKVVPGVKSVEPLLIDVVSFEKSSILAVYVLGWVPDGAMLEEIRIVGGRRIQTGDTNAILLGKVLAQSLGKSTGDVVEIEGAKFAVVGIYESYNMFENSMAIVSLAELQTLMDRKGRVTSFLLQVEHTNDKKGLVDKLCRELESMKDERGTSLGIVAMPTQDHVKTNMELQVARAMAWATAIIALLIGVIGMLNTMMIAVFERTREIGTLRAVGWRRGRILTLILMEAVVICIVGSLLGLGFSFVLTALLSKIEAASIFISGSVNTCIMLTGLALSLGAGILGSLYPALRASRLLPTEALRYE